MKQKIFLTGMLCAGLICGGALLAQRPAENISPQKHPNLAAAQHDLQEAWGKIDEAQHGNKDELGGHANAAKQHIEAADRELKAAAEFANNRK
jgi:hypothetical protein